MTGVPRPMSWLMSIVIRKMLRRLVMRKTKTRYDESRMYVRVSPASEYRDRSL